MKLSSQRNLGRGLEVKVSNIRESEVLLHMPIEGRLLVFVKFPHRNMQVCDIEVANTTFYGVPLDIVSTTLSVALYMEAGSGVEYLQSAFHNWSVPMTQDEFEAWRKESIDFCVESLARYAQNLRYPADGFAEAILKLRSLK